MKSYIYKVLIAAFAVIIIFEFTVGSRIDEINDKIRIFSTADGRQKVISLIKKEMQKANEKENYFEEEERIILRNFIIKIRNELKID
tara:strand:- start:4197 stop:4457 length:261 start_codon:yes stop_codon:yes gene_type:complete